MEPYATHIIASRDGLTGCPEFSVNHYLWNCLRRPVTRGRMGYIPGQGLFLRMITDEVDPLRNLTHHGDAVCNDSAMEAFFAFPKDGGPPADHEQYANFEFNANGALHAAYGRGRGDRRMIDPDEIEAAGVRAGLEGAGWSAELLIPQSFLSRVFGVAELKPGDAFYCNFYKISEDPRIEHYASYSPIDSPTPNFHLPRCFARARVATRAMG